MQKCKGGLMLNIADLVGTLEKTGNEGLLFEFNSKGSGDDIDLKVFETEYDAVNNKIVRMDEIMLDEKTAYSLQPNCSSSQIQDYEYHYIEIHKNLPGFRFQYGVESKSDLKKLFREGNKKVLVRGTVYEYKGNQFFSLQLVVDPRDDFGDQKGTQPIGGIYESLTLRPCPPHWDDSE